MDISMRKMSVFSKTTEKIRNLVYFYKYMQAFKKIRDAKVLYSEIQYRENLGFFFNGKKSMELGNFEPEETAIIENLMNSFDVFINIGANFGYYVCKALSNDLETLAFEPHQFNVNVMLNNIYSNNFGSDFYIFPVALGSSSGILPMYGASTGASLIKGWAGQENSSLVPITTFDDSAAHLIEGKNCLILIDIEGAELECLKGAKSLLSSDSQNVFLIEISTTEHQPSGVSVNPNLLRTFTYMSDFGYMAYTADKNLRKIEIDEVKEIAASLNNTLGTNNFLFVKDENYLPN